MHVQCSSIFVGRDPALAMPPSPLDLLPLFLLTLLLLSLWLALERLAQVSSIEVIPTTDVAPRATATCERFVGSLRRECLAHVLVIGDRQLVRVLKLYFGHFNQARPH
jgi:hypothetical protein